jgi:hypothetical protein
MWATGPGPERTHPLPPLWAVHDAGEDFSGRQRAARHNSVDIQAAHLLDSPEYTVVYMTGQACPATRYSLATASSRATLSAVMKHMFGRRGDS